MAMLFHELKVMLDTGTLLSSFLALLLAYLGGVLSSFTPCVYPLIPITVGFIAGNNERSWKDGLVLSIFYVLGIAVVYSILGILASLSGKIFGSITNTTGWYIFIGCIMVLCSLWMMDVIEFDPNHLASRFRLTPKHRGHHQSHTGQFIGAFLFGASSGLIASPCTTPVLTVILSFIATERSVLFGTALMMAFAMGLGTILIAVGTFTGALKLLPRSGKWLHSIKLVAGFLILGLGQYFIFKAGAVSKFHP